MNFHLTLHHWGKEMLAIFINVARKIMFPVVLPYGNISTPRVKRIINTKGYSNVHILCCISYKAVDCNLSDFAQLCQASTSFFSNRLGCRKDIRLWKLCAKPWVMGYVRGDIGYVEMTLCSRETCSGWIAMRYLLYPLEAAVWFDTVARL